MGLEKRGHMRVKTDERRQVIIAAAAEVFKELGYERASMATISARVGGSKATLYSYFTNKEELFAAVMTNAIEQQAEQIIALLSPSGGDIRAQLLEFGAAYLDLILSPEALAFSRLGISEGAQGKLGLTFYNSGPGRGWTEICAHIERLKAAGELDVPDPHLAAGQLKALLETGTLEPAMYGAPSVVDRASVVSGAVDMFLARYLPRS